MLAGINFVELQTTDPGKANAFFEQLFDWKFESAGQNRTEYAMHQSPTGAHVGMMQALQGQMWLPYVSVPNVADAAKKAQSLGGTVLKERTEIPAGIFAVIADPNGLALALWERKAA